MKFENIKYRCFTLVRTKEEVKEMVKEIGVETNNNIALFCHFVESRKRQRQVIDFEMIEHIEFEISISYQHSKILKELEDLFVELKKELNLFKN